MATIKHNGMELEEVTTPQIFDSPRKCLVWDENHSQYFILPVCAIVQTKRGLRILSDEGNTWQHCAFLPDSSKPRRATNRELARWLAQGNGEIWHGWHGIMSTYFDYDIRKADLPPKDEGDLKFKVRKWSDTEWHEPTVDYLGLDDDHYNFDKKYKGE